MNYASITFLFFILITGTVYFIIPKKFQWLVLLAASAAFYMLSCGLKIFFLMAAAIIIYSAALEIERLSNKYSFQKKGLEKNERKALKKKIDRRKKLTVASAVILTLAMIFSTKYFNFFGSLINGIGGITGHGSIIPTFKILMPLGISYYTLMGISYIVDVYRNTCEAEKNPLRLMLFLCYFPHIVEGPFDRYKILSQQFKTPHYLDYDRIKNGGIRFIWGLFKKVIIADRAGLIVNTIFSDASSYSGSALFIAVILYTLQIYAEFSGCMDMVCGISQMFGINISENFKRPFFSASISEFWRRWHITLGLWLKDYIFYPVSLSAHFKRINEFLKKHIRSSDLLALLPSAYALLFVWFSNGLWHGASGKYIFYGLYYYLLMMLGQALKPVSDKALQSLRISRDNTWYHRFEVLRTCAIVCMGMLIFRAESLRQAGEIAVKIFTDFVPSALADGTLLVSGVHIYDYFILGISFVLLLAVSLMEEKGYDFRQQIEKQILPLRWSIYMVMLFSIIIFGAYGGDFTNTAFIYGEF